MANPNMRNKKAVTGLSKIKLSSSKSGNSTKSFVGKKIISKISYDNALNTFQFYFWCIRSSHVKLQTGRLRSSYQDL